MSCSIMWLSWVSSHIWCHSLSFAMPWSLCPLSILFPASRPPLSMEFPLPEMPFSLSFVDWLLLILRSCHTHPLFNMDFSTAVPTSDHLFPTPTHVPILHHPFSSFLCIQFVIIHLLLFLVRHLTKYQVSWVRSLFCHAQRHSQSACANYLKNE